MASQCNDINEFPRHFCIICNSRHTIKESFILTKKGGSIYD